MQFDRIVFNHTPGPCRTVPDIGEFDYAVICRASYFILLK